MCPLIEPISDSVCHGLPVSYHAAGRQPSRALSGDLTGTWPRRVSSSQICVRKGTHYALTVLNMFLIGQLVTPYYDAPITLQKSICRTVNYAVALLGD